MPTRSLQRPANGFTEVMNVVKNVENTPDNRLKTVTMPCKQHATTPSHE